METSEIITIAAGLLALIIAGVAFYRSGKPFTLASAGELISQAEPLSAKIDLYARSVVLGIQQLKADGQIVESDEAIERALLQLELDFPDVEPQVLVDRIEFWYQVIKPLFKPKPLDVAGPFEAE